MSPNTNIVKNLKEVHLTIGTSHTELSRVSHQLQHVSGQVLPDLLNKIREGLLQLADQLKAFEASDSHPKGEDETTKQARLRGEIVTATAALYLEKTESQGSEAIGYEFAMDLVLPTLKSDHLESLLANIKEAGRG